MQEAQLTKKESGPLLWEKWKYRQELFWKSLYRWGTAAIAVSIVPWVQTELVYDLGLMVLFFSCLASMIAGFVSWLIAAEYERFNKVDKKYRGILGKYAPDPISNPLFPTGWLWELRIGCVVLFHLKMLLFYLFGRFGLRQFTQGS